MDYLVIDVAGTGNNIKKLLDDSGYSVGIVADYLGTTNSLVYRYIKGDVLPSTDRLYALSIMLGVTVNDILVAS